MHERTDVVFSWLRAMKNLNHFYANITIDDMTEMEASLEHIADDLIQHNRIVSDDVGIDVDRLATAEREQPIAPMHGQEPEEDMELPQSAQLPAVFLVKSAHPTSDRGGPAVQVLQSLRDTLSSGSTTDERSDSNGGGVGEVGSVVDPETQSDVAEAEASAESHETARIDIPDVRGHRPMCEFEGNDRLLYFAFPFLFLLGSGLRKPGSLQRNASTRAVTARFNNNPESLEKLQAWVADPAFLQDLLFESIELDPREDADRVCNDIATAAEETDVALTYPPLHINVAVPSAKSADFVEKTLEPGRVVIPVPRVSKWEPVDIKLPGRRQADTFHYRPHGVEQRFAVTVHKIQGQTWNKVILQLNKRSFMPHLTFSMLYVALSRVRTRGNIRLMPPHPTGPGLG
ncbi:Uncharacterized protein APZ42_030106 [Daphnia magna]|nr:Uncharacterized protein APZ42_030106 [Daphnia magna]